jgi:hypothetical protein
MNESANPEISAGPWPGDSVAVSPDKVGRAAANISQFVKYSG